jgi:hypothetical protein
MISVINIPAGRKAIVQNFSDKVSTSVSSAASVDNTIVKSLKPLHVKNEEAVVNLVQYLGQSNIITKLNYNLAASRAFNDNQHQVTLNFVLAEKYASHFVLLRGLFEFNNIKAASVAADRTNRSFSVVLNENATSSIIDYFEIIFNSLIKEINFKTILRGIIKLEERIKREQTLAYETLRAAV